MAGEFSLDPSMMGMAGGYQLKNPLASTPPPAMGGKYGGIDPALFAKMMRSFGGGAPGGGGARAAAAQQMYGSGPGNSSYAKRSMFSPELASLIDIGTKVAPLL